MLINNDEIYALYHSISELEATSSSIIQKVFNKSNNKQLFDEFRSKIMPHDTKLVSALTYAIYLLNWYLNPRNDSTTMTVKLFNDYPIGESFFFLENPFEIISIFYTCESLLHKDMYFKYADYKELRSTKTELYETVSTSSKTGFFYHATSENLEKSKELLKKQKNSTRYISEAENSVFCKAINYRTDVKLQKKGKVYYLSNFLPEFSFLVGEKSHRHSLEKYKDFYNADNFHSVLSHILKNFFEIGAQLYDPDNLFQNILNFYKLEYTFGIFSLSSYLYENKRKPIKNTDFFSRLIHYQETPSVFSTYRLGLFDIEADDKCNELHIFSAKFVMALLFNLYDNNIESLLKDLKSCIKTMYKNNNPNNCLIPSPKELNGWHLMHHMFNTFHKNTERICTEYKTLIDERFSKLKPSEQDPAKKYLLFRYSSEWFENIEKLFSLDILAMI